MKWNIPRQNFQSRRVINDLENGYYPATIISVLDRQDRRGRPFCRITFLINDEKFDWLIFEGQLWKMRMIAEACGLLEAGEAGEVDTADLVNKEVYIEVVDGKINIYKAY